MADLNCGTRLPQTLRLSMDYRRRGAWLDALVYSVAERECTRLKCALPASESEDLSLTVMPLSRVRRIIYVAPDFAELSTLKGFKALPACHTASLDERRAMRYFEDMFFPWD